LYQTIRSYVSHEQSVRVEWFCSYRSFLCGDAIKTIHSVIIGIGCSFVIIAIMICRIAISPRIWRSITERIYIVSLNRIVVVTFSIIVISFVVLEIIVVQSDGVLLVVTSANQCLVESKFVRVLTQNNVVVQDSPLCS